MRGGSARAPCSRPLGTPAAYLDPKVRRSISSFWKIGDVTEPLRRLKDDLQSGEWERKYSRFLEQKSCDFGYHLLVAS
jgi:hypothetical protein